MPGVSIWQEQIDLSHDRTYSLAPQPASPPTSSSLTKAANPPRGISIIAFNADGSLLATKDDAVPTTVWIWSLQSGIAIAILIHHSPVKHIAWHPTESDLLLVQCAISVPWAHLWKSSWEAPRIARLSLGRTAGKLEAGWLLSPESSQYNLMISSAHQFNTTLLSVSGEIVSQPRSIDEGDIHPNENNAEELFDEGNSFDLSPIKITHDETIDVDDNEISGSVFGMGNEMVDDTFHYRRHVRAIG